MLRARGMHPWVYLAEATGPSRVRGTRSSKAVCQGAAAQEAGGTLEMVSLRTVESRDRVQRYGQGIGVLWSWCRTQDW